MAYYSKKITEKNRNILECFDIETGIQKWERTIPHKYGWTETIRFSDTSMAIVSSGLHILNTQTGGGWSYKGKTGDEIGPNSGELIALNALGIGLGILTGTFFVTGGHSQLLGNLHSNLLVGDSSYCIALRENLVSLNKKTGKVNWNLPFEQDDIASKSLILEKNNIIYMINQGFGLTAKGPSRFGKPFLMAVDAKSGVKKYQQFLPKKDILYDILVKNDTIICLQEKKIAKYLLTDGSKINERLHSEMEVLKNISKFTPNYIFVQSADSSYSQLINQYKNFVCVQTSIGNTLVLADNLEVKTEIFRDDYFYSFGNYQNFKILVSLKKLILVDEKGQSVATIQDYTQFPVIKDGLLFLTLRGKEKLAIVKLEDLLN